MSREMPIAVVAVPVYAVSIASHGSPASLNAARTAWTPSAV